MSKSLSDVLVSLEDAITALLTAHAIEAVQDSDAGAYDDVITQCERLERNVQRIKSVAERRYKYLTAQPATIGVMTGFIVKELAKAEPQEKGTVKAVKDLAGGEATKVLRRAGGKCELCGSEWHLSVHHIIPRSDGGLSLEDNLIALCKSCHDEVEDCGYHSRAEVLQHKWSREIALQQPRVVEADDAKRSAITEKAAATRAANAIKEAHEEKEITAWAAQWEGYYWQHVSYVTFGQEPPPDPAWYAVVYGGGRLDDVPRNRR